jgi:predicted NAD/FAD-binding protein
MDAQARLEDIQGVDKFWFCGAWTRWGFHEDGILSAVKICNALGVKAPWQTS